MQQFERRRQNSYRHELSDELLIEWNVGPVYHKDLKDPQAIAGDRSRLHSKLLIDYNSGVKIQDLNEQSFSNILSGNEIEPKIILISSIALLAFIACGTLLAVFNFLIWKSPRFKNFIFRHRQLAFL